MKPNKKTLKLEDAIPAFPSWPIHPNKERYALVDYETYYDKECSVKTLGPDAYVRHPDFDAYMVSIVTEEWEWVGHPSEAPWDYVDGFVFAAHNKQFDWTVHNWVVARYKIKARPVRWICTAALAAWLRLPRNLGGAIKAKYGVDLDKGMRSWMEGRRWEDVTSSEPEKAERMKTYCLDDSRWAFRLLTDHIDQWPVAEQWLAEHTVIRGMHGLRLDLAALEKGIRALDKEIFSIETERLPWVADGEKPSSPKALAATCRKHGIEPPKSTAEDSPEREAWEEEYGDRFPWIGAMTEWRKANRMLKILKKLQMRVRPPDAKGVSIFSFNIKYGGAHTMRWSGDSGYNMHGMASEPVCGVDQRRLHIARPGMKFLIADYAQIEPRILHWIVGDSPWLEAAAEPGADIYEVHARLSMGYDREEPLKSLVEIDPAMKKMRKLAKAREIGLGYGCGHVKFVVVAKTMAGLIINPRESKVQVNDWRQKSPKITRLWDKLGAQIGLAARRSTEYTMELPSGRQMTYFNVVLRQGQVMAQDTLGERHISFYGGKLTENMVQATARDLIADACFRVETELQYTVPWHTHDELIIEMPEKDDPIPVIEIMEAGPAWAAGLPIATEWKESKFYTK